MYTPRRKSEPRSRANKIGHIATLVITMFVALISATILIAYHTPGKSSASPDPRLSALTTNRAMWLWNWDNNENVITYATENNVSDIFVYTPPDFKTNPTVNTRLTNLSKAGNAHNIRMWAMGGDPSWTLDHKVAIRWTRDVIKSKLYTGIHLELEPHNAKTFINNPNYHYAQYLKLLEQIQTIATPAKMTIELSLPWWYHEIPNPTPSDNTLLDTLDAAAINIVNQVAIITFNTTSEGIENDAHDATLAAQQINKPYRYASETNNVEPSRITFYGKTNETMLSTQNTVTRSHASDPLYLGFAVQEYIGWKQLPR